MMMMIVMMMVMLMVMMMVLNVHAQRAGTADPVDRMCSRYRQPNMAPVADVSVRAVEARLAADRHPRHRLGPRSLPARPTHRLYHRQTHRYAVGYIIIIMVV